MRAEVVWEKKDMAEVIVGSDFKQSYENYLSYPTRLIYKTTYPTELQNYKARLDQASDNLCIRDEKRIDVGFRDWVPANSIGKFHKLTVLRS